MENITLGQISAVVAFLSVFIAGLSGLYGMLMKGIDNQFTKNLKPIKDELEEEKKSRLKSELTTFMFLAESGSISPEQKILAHEDYDEYIRMKGNSYIHDKFEELHRGGKI